MIEYIKTIFQHGDQIRITGREGIFEGAVEQIGKDFIALKLPNGAIQGIHISAIQTFATPNAALPIFNNPALAVPGAIQVIRPDSSESVKTKKEKQPEAEPEQATEESQSFRQYKPGDKIPLSQLAQIDPELGKQWKHSEQKKKLKEESPIVTEELKALLENLRTSSKKEDLVVPSHQGLVVEFQPGFNFAFLDDAKDNTRCFFNKTDIVDQSILENSATSIPVMYTRAKNMKGSTAKSIHKPLNVLDTIELAIKLYSKGDSYRAIQVLNNLQKLSSSDSVGKALAILNSYKNASSPIGANNVQKDQLLHEANEAKSKGMWSEAIKLYKQAMNNGSDTINCVKEVSKLYVLLFNQVKGDSEVEVHKEEAVEFANKYKYKLGNNLQALIELEELLYTINQYDEHIDIAEELITQTGRRGDLKRYVQYLVRVADSYYNIEDLERAMDACRQGLEVEPGDPYLLKIFQMIMQHPLYTPEDKTAEL